jgi:hypothetical protein
MNIVKILAGLATVRRGNTNKMKAFRTMLRVISVDWNTWTCMFTVKASFLRSTGGCKETTRNQTSTLFGILSCLLWKKVENCRKIITFFNTGRTILYNRIFFILQLTDSTELICRKLQKQSLYYKWDRSNLRATETRHCCNLILFIAYTQLNTGIMFYTSNLDVYQTNRGRSGAYLKSSSPIGVLKLQNSHTESWIRISLASNQTEISQPWNWIHLICCSLPFSVCHVGKESKWPVIHRKPCC